MAEHCTPAGGAGLREYYRGGGEVIAETEKLIV